MVEAPLVCDIRRYNNRFTELSSSLGFEEAKKTLEDIITADSYGTIVEKVVTEKDKGNLVFPLGAIAKIQQTPIEHSYLEVMNGEGQSVMACPENAGLAVDIMENISPWRRGLDRLSMGMVKELFLQKDEDGQDEVKNGEMIIWGSPIAEKWEGSDINDACGDYGYLYAGRVISEGGKRVLLVHDIRNDLSSEAYHHFFNSLNAEIYDLNWDISRPLLDRVMTTVVRLRTNFTDQEILTDLSKSKTEITGDGTIFNLDLPTLISLQDLKLRDQIRNEVSRTVARWITDQIASGVPINQVQDQVRAVYIRKTRQFLAGERKVYVPVGDVRYTDSIREADLTQYKVSSGLACGGWGSGSTTLLLLSEPGREAYRCLSCGEVNICNSDKCYACNGLLVKLNKN